MHKIMRSPPCHSTSTILILWILGSVCMAADEPGRSPIDGLIAPDPTLFAGTVVHRVPFELPPGPAGVVPSISLVANHQVGEGIVGAGWALEGVSRIEMKSATFGVPDGYDGTFWLDGEQLIPVGADYRLKHDDNRIFTPHIGTTTVSIEYWEARRDGWMWIYGRQEVGGDTVGSMATEAMGDSPTDACFVNYEPHGLGTAWWLSRIVDPAGNEIQYSYVATCPWALFGSGAPFSIGPTYLDGAHRYARVLAGITYANGQAHIDLEYQTRPDYRVDGSSGVLQILDRRLKAIEARVGSGVGEFYSRYELEYFDESSSWCDGTDISDEQRESLSDLSILARVTRVGSDGSTKLLRCNTVNADATELDEARPLPLDPPSTFSDIFMPIPVNFKYDSWMDLVILAFPTDGKRLDSCEAYQNTGTNWDSSSTSPFVPDPDLKDIIEEVLTDAFLSGGGGWQFFDVDGDGRTNLVAVACDYSEVVEYSIPLESYQRIHTLVDLQPWHLLYGQPVDVNGDGLLDLVISPHAESYPTSCEYDSDITQWIPNAGVSPYLDKDDIRPLVTPVENPYSAARLELESIWADCAVHGDHIERYPEVSVPVRHGPNWIATPTGFTFSNEFEYMAAQARWGDLNGDGIADIAYSFYPCWVKIDTENSGGAWDDRDDPGCPSQLSYSSVNYWPCGTEVFTRMFYGDGNGGFHDTALPAGPPYLRISADHVTPTGWDWTDPGCYFEDIYGQYAWRSWNGWGIGEFDGSGRLQLIHCHYLQNRHGARLAASVDRGLLEGFGLGEKYASSTSGYYAVGLEGEVDDCAHDISFPGHAMQDLWAQPLVQLVADWNGDRYTDVLRIYNQITYFEDPPGSAPAGCDGSGPTLPFAVEFYNNPRTKSRGRLERIQTAWGGEIALTYASSTQSPGPAFSSRFGCAGGGELPYVIEVIESVTDEKGTRAFALLNGAHDVSERRFAGFQDVFTSWESGRTTHQQYSLLDRIRGRLKQQAEYDKSGQLEFLSLFSYDETSFDGPPYFYPLTRRCDFWVSGAVSPSALTDACCDFFQNPKGNDCGIYDNFGCIPPARDRGFAPIVGTEMAEIVQPETPMFVAPTPTNQYLMYAQEWNYSSPYQQLIEHIDYRRADLPGDDIRTTFTFDAWLPDAAGQNLTSIIQFDSSGATLNSISRSNFSAFNQPDIVTEFGRPGATCGPDSFRRWTYVHDRGDVIESLRIGDAAPTSYVRNDWGQITQRTDPDGRSEAVVFDKTRPKRREFEGAVTTTTYDGLGREATIELDLGAGAPLLTETYQRNDDILPPDLSTPNAIITYADGTQKELYLDEWGRPALEVYRGDNDGDGSIDDPIRQFHGYARDGSVRVLSRMHGQLERTSGTWSYADEFGRLVAQLTPAHVPAAAANASSFVITRFSTVPGATMPDSTLGVRTAQRNPSGVESETRFNTLGRWRYLGTVLQQTEAVDPIGLVTMASDADGVRFRYEYDRFNRRCAQELDGSVRLWDGSTATPRWEYEWDLRDRQLSTTDPQGNVTQWDYDDLDRRLEERFYDHVAPTTAEVLQRREYVDFAEGGGSRSVTDIDRNGNRTERFFDGGDRLIRTEFPDGTVEERDWDNRGRLSALTTVDGTEVSYEYNSFGRVIRETGPDPSWMKSRTYNNQGELDSETDADGVTTLRIPFWSGLPATVTRGTWTLVDRAYRDDGLVVQAFEDGVVTAFEYDALGRRISACVGRAGPADCAIELAWTWTDGNRVDTETRGTHTTEYTYDFESASGTGLGWVMQVTHPDGTTEDWGRDILGRVREHYDEERVLSEYEYDGLGRLKSEDLPGQGTRTFDYLYGVTHPLGASYGFAAQTVRNEPDGGIWRTFTDFAGRPVQFSRPDNTADWQQWTGSRLLEVRHGIPGASPTYLARRVFSYDSNARLSSVWGPVTEVDYAAGPGADSFIYSYTWTPAGRIDTIAGPNDETHYAWTGGYLSVKTQPGVTQKQYQYQTNYPRVETILEGLGTPRITTLTWFRGVYLVDEEIVDGPNTLTNTLGSFDDYGTPRELHSTLNGVPQCDYLLTTDSRGRVTRSDTQIEDTPFVRVDRGYYSNGQIQTIDALWWGSGHMEHLFFDRPNSDRVLEQVLNGTGTLQYGGFPFADRDPLGRPQTVNLNGGGSVTRDYDQRGRIVAQATTNSLGATQRRGYTFDPRGRLSELVLTPPTGPIRRDRFFYQEPGWLTREVRRFGATNEQELTFDYDAAGNRIERTVELPGGGVATNTYSHDVGSNRLMVVDGTPMAWDNFGGVIVDHRGNQIHRDPTGRESAVVDPGGATLYSIVRDPLRRPIQTTLANGRRKQVWGNPGGPWPLIGETETGEPIMWVAAEGMLLARVQGFASTVHPTAVDSRSSLIMYDNAFLGETGAWGDTAAPSAPGGSEQHIYAALDNLTGPFMLAQHRLYDPDLGQFMSVDPIDQPGNDYSFAYVRNDPLGYLDPAGLFGVPGGGFTGTWNVTLSQSTSYWEPPGSGLPGDPTGGRCDLVCQYKNRGRTLADGASEDCQEGEICDKGGTETKKSKDGSSTPASGETDASASPEVLATITVINGWGVLEERPNPDYFNWRSVPDWNDGGDAGSSSTSTPGGGGTTTATVPPGSESTEGGGVSYNSLRADGQIPENAKPGSPFGGGLKEVPVWNPPAIDRTQPAEPESPSPARAGSRSLARQPTAKSQNKILAHFPDGSVLEQVTWNGERKFVHNRNDAAQTQVIYNTDGTIYHWSTITIPRPQLLRVGRLRVSLEPEIEYGVGSVGCSSDGACTVTVGPVSCDTGGDCGLSAERGPISLFVDSGGNVTFSVSAEMGILGLSISGTMSPDGVLNFEAGGNLGPVHGAVPIEVNPGALPDY